jgi:3-oxosteroid 1-dehydrogenase
MVPFKRYEEEGFMARADSLGELARKIDVNPNGLEDTVKRMNEYARSGKDPDHNRGELAYDRYYGDARVKPNPCLGPVDTPPYYAVRVDPGDFGTQGGMVINEHAQVLHEDGHVIEGLYATGNCAAPTLPCYPGPGSTLGPAMTFAYQAAKAITGYTDP